MLAGTSDYEHIKLERLPAVRNNLVGLEQAFTNPVTGVFASQSCTIIDTPDSARSLMQRLSRTAREAEDVFIAYYAGHGLLDLRSKLCLSVRETDPQQLDGTAVPFEWVRDAILESPARVRILILDCCFSGRAIGAMSSDSAALEQIKINGTTILTSTTANDISQSPPGERYTAFTAELIGLLTEPDSHVMTLGDLYGPLRAAMARRGLPSPKVSVGDSSGSLIIRRPLTPPRIDEDRVYSDPNLNRILPPGPSPNPVFNPMAFSPAPTYPITEPTHKHATTPRPQLQYSMPPTRPSPALPTPSEFRVQVRGFWMQVRRGAPFSIIIILYASALLAGGTLGVGIDQAVRGQDENGGAVGLAFALVFCAAWFLGSIFLLVLMHKRSWRKRRQKSK